VIWEVFDHIITGWDASGDTNTTFLQTVKATQEKMDKGIHIGWFGQIQGSYIRNYLPFSFSIIFFLGKLYLSASLTAIRMENRLGPTDR
jgi:hypothetical protein